MGELGIPNGLGLRGFLPQPNGFRLRARCFLCFEGIGIRLGLGKRGLAASNRRGFGAGRFPCFQGLGFRLKF